MLRKMIKVISNKALIKGVVTIPIHLIYNDPKEILVDKEPVIFVF